MQSGQQARVGENAERKDEKDWSATVTKEGEACNFSDF